MDKEDFYKQIIYMFKYHFCESEPTPEEAKYLDLCTQTRNICIIIDPQKQIAFKELLDGGKIEKKPISKETLTFLSSIINQTTSSTIIKVLSSQPLVLDVGGIYYVALGDYEIYEVLNAERQRTKSQSS